MKLLFPAEAMDHEPYQQPRKHHQGGKNYGINSRSSYFINPSGEDPKTNTSKTEMENRPQLQTKNN